MHSRQPHYQCGILLSELSRPDPHCLIFKRKAEAPTLTPLQEPTVFKTAVAPRPLRLPNKAPDRTRTCTNTVPKTAALSIRQQGQTSAEAAGLEPAHAWDTYVDGLAIRLATITTRFQDTKIIFYSNSVYMVYLFLYLKSHKKKLSNGNFYIIILNFQASYFYNHRLYDVHLTALYPL